MSNKIFVVGISLFLLVFLFNCGSPKREGNPKVLVFSKTEGFRHNNIEFAAKAIKSLGGRKGFEVEISEDSELFTDENLKQYSAIVFLNTTGDILNTNQEIAMERYIQAGGGFVGIHAAADTEYDWKWYGRLVGAYFKSHPHQQNADLIIHPDPKFPLLDSFPNPWNRKDEWYNFRKIPDHVNVLVSIDESTYEGGSNDGNHPMVWYHEYDGGRGFYIELGHTEESFEEPLFLDLLYAGIEYAIGDNKILDYNKSTSVFQPEENRFSKVRLGSGFDEPTEMTILPDNSILISERKGGLKLYNPESGLTTQIGKFDVYHRTDVQGVNVEMGFMGIQADPDYASNHWVYVFYSPLQPSVDRLSRFKFENGVWDMDSEQVILDVEVDRDICCHTGGSIAFDSDGNLYVSTGDNSTPFNERDPETGKLLGYNLYGYSPLDDRPGFYNYDARRASGNTNDLRGKILRIKVQEDGSYTIPDGNLFEEGNDRTRPEIYVMGNRNPYRISVDQKTGYLYWGEVGPDARMDSLDSRGPKGYDEINQARKAGNFGWPYFVGDNFAYWQYDYETGESQLKFDPEKPVNNSRHNTGLVELPPAKGAFIYYPYDVSPEFPILKSGGRNAMAGPVYYREFYPDATRLPEYFDGKLFIYDWIRNWIMLVSMDEEGDLLRIDPFMPNTTFYNMIDMEVGSDGTLYILEYGTGWFTKNDNSGLYKIDFNPGNRPPAAMLEVESLAGAVPYELQLDASKSTDPDGDVLRYSWYLNDELLATTKEPQYNHVIEEPGVYTTYVSVDDGNEAVERSGLITIIAGNSRPMVEIEIEGNQQFYFDNSAVKYAVRVEDPEDGSFENGGLDESRLMIRADYLTSFDRAATTLGHQEFVDPALEVEAIMAKSDCASCHKLDEESIGPSYVAVAQKYRNNPNAEVYLMDKIKNGGSGVWGEVAMSAHPDINEVDLRKMVQWIQSLGEEQSDGSSLPREGRLVPRREFDLTDHGTLLLEATYTDKGGPGTEVLTGRNVKYLSGPVIFPHQATEVNGASAGNYQGTDFLALNAALSHANLGKIDLTDVKRIEVSYIQVEEGESSAEISLHAGSPQGPVIASGETSRRDKPMEPHSITMRLDRDLRSPHEAVWLVAKREEGSPAVVLIKMELKD